MLVPISATYAALLALVGIVLQQLVGRVRLQQGISLGDGGDPTLKTAMRRQANFVEQVPMAVLLLVLLELNGTSAVWLHGLGSTLLIARVAHPLGLDARDMKRWPRLVGALLTLAVVVASAVLAIAVGF